MGMGTVAVIPLAWSLAVISRPKSQTVRTGGPKVFAEGGRFDGVSSSADVVAHVATKRTNASDEISSETECRFL
jgi:hypothetical protein